MIDVGSVALDELVEKAVLVLRENGDPGATVNAETAKVLACPVTESFWADGAGAAWKARPSYDCDLASAAGERDAKTGVWTFDLTAVASLWTAEGHKGSTSVALVEGGEPDDQLGPGGHRRAEGRQGHVEALLGQRQEAGAVHVTLEGELVAGEAASTAQVMIDYVPARSSRAVTLGFPTDPRHGRLSLRFTAYTEP